jgi:hypothetical protein
MSTMSAVNILDLFRPAPYVYLAHFFLVTMSLQCLFRDVVSKLMFEPFLPILMQAFSIKLSVELVV